MKCCPGKDRLPSIRECGDRNDFQLLAIVFYWDFFRLVTLSNCHLVTLSLAAPCNTQDDVTNILHVTTR